MQKWYEWLVYMKKKDEKENLEEIHQRKVEKMGKSAEGSAGLLHKITKPTMLRRGVQIMEKEEEDATLLDRCEAKEKNGKPWRNEELKECEEAVSRLKEGDLEKASRLYKAKTGVGCNGFHPNVPLDLTTETKGVANDRNKLAQRCSS